MQMAPPWRRPFQRCPHRRRVDPRGRGNPPGISQGRPGFVQVAGLLPGLLGMLAPAPCLRRGRPLPGKRLKAWRRLRGGRADWGAAPLRTLAEPPSYDLLWVHRRGGGETALGCEGVEELCPIEFRF